MLLLLLPSLQGTRQNGELFSGLQRTCWIGRSTEPATKPLLALWKT